MKKYSSKFGIEIPAEHLIDRDGTTFIRFGGLLYLVNEMGAYRCETKDVSTDPQNEIVYECKGWLIPNENYYKVMGIDPASPLADMFRQPVITHGTTNPQNLRANMAPHRTVMAETRAIVRNLRILTGCSLCGEDELDTFQFVPEKVVELQKMSGGIISANNMLDAPAEPKNRGEFIKAIEYMGSKSAGVKTLIQSTLDQYDANILQNFSDPMLKQLYDGCLEMMAE